MLRKLRIQNFKSILDDSLELGRINVFIGENGCGKTNILEALAMAGAALHGDLDAEGLFNRGIRLARPSLTTSAFAGNESGTEIAITCDSVEPIRVDHVSEPPGITGSQWRVTSMSAAALTVLDRMAVEIATETSASLKRTQPGDVISLNMDRVSELLQRLNANGSQLSPGWPQLKRDLENFVLYTLSTQALRGLQSTSRKQPLGIHGEGLDTAIATFDDTARGELAERASCISWMDRIDLDIDDRLKLQGFKPGRGTSRLYFMDRFMAADNNVFSAENANEGILHVLFYLALFISRGTPPIFGIDNIETALNPQLCRDLIKQVVELAAKHDKQALITTHNPAVLDGLNLHDDEQRLFVVERNDEGHTQTRRVKLKPDAGDGKQYKLSELWMRGHLGGLPRGF